ncbi:uncharacterized protein PV07_06596 [Cladophialophora immunda]|uniref:Uncharacterized protein n=1 Tax=Cladophialophora immunda TaxID=569365 RepID=A0A0D2C8H3_9EURO|nr:uncharacterized protein PV07_06596 [Cladophialophora immunda]KIW26790.1 hypothetical protein PV07_06596 [Cladophialophora immunda]
MLISKPHSRLLSVVTILVIVALRSLCGWRVDGSLIFQFGQRSDKSSTSNKPSNSKGWIYSGPKAEDKAVILAKVRGEDVDWVFDNLQDWKQAIYYMDDPREGVLHPPLNKGREAMAYLTFIIDHYDVLPAYMVFVHPHLQGWPAAWHTDSQNHNQINSIRSLRLKYLEDNAPEFSRNYQNGEVLVASSPTADKDWMAAGTQSLLEPYLGMHDFDMNGSNERAVEEVELSAIEA